MFLKVPIYKLLSAVIGSSFAALFAGRTPKVKPIVPEMITVINTVPNPIDAGRGVNKATTFTVAVSYTHLTLPTIYSV